METNTDFIHRRLLVGTVKSYTIDQLRVKYESQKITYEEH